MPAKPSGEIKTKIVHQTQKNGDIYVLERKTIYDPEKKYNRVLKKVRLSLFQQGQKRQKSRSRNKMLKLFQPKERVLA